MKSADTPAMPLTGDAYIDFAAYANQACKSYNPDCHGLTKREMIAMHAMQGILAGANSRGLSLSSERAIAKSAVNIANSLLAELNE